MIEAGQNGRCDMSDVVYAERECHRNPSLIVDLASRGRQGCWQELWWSASLCNQVNALAHAAEYAYYGFQRVSIAGI